MEDLIVGAIDDAHSAFGDLREDTVVAEHAADYQNDVITLLRTCLAVMFGLRRFRRDVGAVRIQASTASGNQKTGQEPEERRRTVVLRAHPIAARSSRAPLN